MIAWPSRSQSISSRRGANDLEHQICAPVGFLARKDDGGTGGPVLIVRESRPDACPRLHVAGVAELRQEPNPLWGQSDPEL